jgi:hypothetical protein
MMRLPARLTAKLAKTRIAQIFHSAPGGSLIHCVGPAEVLHPGSATPVSREKIQGLIAHPAPVIWIGGSEPLVHPGIGHFVRVVAQRRHFVFLETNGIFLRRRIHEFQPLPELFLTVRLDSPQDPESALAFEGLRAARLSGFFTVVHSLIREDSDLAQLHAFRSLLLEKDVDGWLITSECDGEAVARKSVEARSLIPAGFWRQFSEHVEEALLTQTPGRELHSASTSATQSPRAEACEEGVRIA